MIPPWFPFSSQFLRCVMRTAMWVKSFFSGLGLCHPRRRVSVWQKAGRQSQELQALEPRTMMSGVSINADPYSYLPSDAACLPYGDPAVSPPLYGPPARFGSTPQFVPQEDLFDEGAGAVWGGLMEPSAGGGNSYLSPGDSSLMLIGDPDDNFDEPWSDIGGMGAGGAICGAATGGYGGGGDATGGNDTGGSGYGGGTSGNRQSVEIDIEIPDRHILEGPYTESRLDRTTLIIQHLSPLLKTFPSVARLRMQGRATPGQDFRIMQGPTNLFINKLAEDDYYCDVVLLPGTSDTRLQMISQPDIDYENQETIFFTLIPHPNGTTKPEQRDPIPVTIEDATADLVISTIGNRGYPLTTPYEDQIGCTSASTMTLTMAQKFRTTNGISSRVSTSMRWRMTGSRCL